MTDRCWIGVDPGIDGAVAIVWDSGRAEVHDLPKLTAANGREELNPHALLDLLTEDDCRGIWIEQVGPMPRQGVTSTFRFGVAFGTILGCAAATDAPMHLIRPQAWKKGFRLPADKEPARMEATRRFPGLADRLKRKKDHGRAEALLIARYGSWEEEP